MSVCQGTLTAINQQTLLSQFKNIPAQTRLCLDLRIRSWSYDIMCISLGWTSRLLNCSHKTTSGISHFTSVVHYIKPQSHSNARITTIQHKWNLHSRKKNIRDKAMLTCWSQRAVCTH